MKPELTGSDTDIETLVLALCDEVLAQPSEQRADYLARRCAGQPELRAGVESVLRAIDASGCFLKIEMDEEEL